jgi:hypothetical protein
MLSMTDEAGKERELEIAALAGPIIALALLQVPAFVADRSGETAARFLRQHRTDDSDVDRSVRCFIDYSLALRGLRGPA